MADNEKFSDKRSRPATIALAIAGIALLILGKSVGSVFGRAAGHAATENVRSGYEEGFRDETVIAGVKQAVAQLKHRVPVRVNDDVTMRKVEAAGKEIVYYMDVATPLTDDEMAAFKSNIEEGHQQQLCGTEATKDMIRMGGKFTYRYSFQNGSNYVTTFSFC